MTHLSTAGWQQHRHTVLPLIATATPNPQPGGMTDRALQDSRTRLMPPIYVSHLPALFLPRSPCSPGPASFSQAPSRQRQPRVPHEAPTASDRQNDIATRHGEGDGHMPQHIMPCNGTRTKGRSTIPCIDRQSMQLRTMHLWAL